MSVIDRIHDPVLDQRSDTVFLGVRRGRLSRRSHDRRQDLQVAGVASNDLRANFRVVFLRGCRVDIGGVQRFDIHESVDFRRLNALDGSVCVVAAWLISVEPSRINTGVVSAFLGRRAKKRTLRLGRNPSIPRAENGVVWQSCETDLFKNAGHFAEQIHRDTVEFAQIDTGCI